MKFEIADLLAMYRDAEEGVYRASLAPMRHLSKQEDCVFSADDGNEHVIFHDVETDTYVAIVMSVEIGAGGLGGYVYPGFETGVGDVILAERFAVRSKAFKEVLEIITTDNESI